MNDNRYIKFVDNRYRIHQDLPPVRRRSLGFSGCLGVLIWAAVFLWFFKGYLVQ